MGLYRAPIAWTISFILSPTCSPFLSWGLSDAIVSQALSPISHAFAVMSQLEDLVGRINGGLLLPLDVMGLREAMEKKHA